MNCKKEYNKMCNPMFISKKIHNAYNFFYKIDGIFSIESIETKNYSFIKGHILFRYVDELKNGIWGHSITYLPQDVRYDKKEIKDILQNNKIDVKTKDIFSMENMSDVDNLAMFLSLKLNSIGVLCYDGVYINVEKIVLK